MNRPEDIKVSQAEVEKLMVQEKVYKDVLHASRPFWLSRLFARFYCLIILLLVALQAVSIVITIKYSLLKTYSLSARDIFVSNDVRTQRMDVENALNEKARNNAETLRAEIAGVEDLFRSGDLKGLIDKVANIIPTQKYVPPVLFPTANERSRNL